MSQSGDWIRVALVLRPHGLQGEVSVQLLGGGPDRLRPGLELRSRLGPTRVESVRGASGQQLICRLQGVSDAVQAGRLRGAYLELPRERARKLPRGEFFHFQLVGLEVLDERGRSRGQLVDVEPYPANDVYVVREGAAEVRIPATREAVLGIDLERGRVVVAERFLEEAVDAL